MAKVTDVNNSPANGAEAVFLLKETLVDAGWTVISSSDGTTYNASGDELATAADLNNANAWFRIQDPGGRREFTFQRGAANTDWRIKYSASARFTGGSPGATETPSATDGQILSGGGTDASPTFAAQLPSGGTYKWHVVAMDAPEGNVYAWYALATENTSGSDRTFWAHDALAVGSYPAADTEPCVQLFDYRATAPWAADFSRFGSSTSLARAWLNGTWITMPACGVVDGSSRRIFPPNSTTQGGGTDPFSGEQRCVPVIWAQYMGTPRGYKGHSKFLKYPGYPLPYPNTFNSASDAYVFLNNLLVPFENGTPPQI